MVCTVTTKDGLTHELDIIIFVTGFDAIDGNYNRMRIRGLGDETLKEHWKKGPTSYLGISVPNFPNLFMITGPQGPFCNIPPAIETHVELISELIERAEKHREKYGSQTSVEASTEAEAGWLRHCEELVNKTLFKTTESWIFGSNVEGKQYATRFYFGGLAEYRGCLKPRAVEFTPAPRFPVKGQRGSICNISSVAGLHSMGLGAYTPSKFAVIGITKNGAKFYGPSAIRCNAICPGWTMIATLEGLMGNEGKEGDIATEQSATLSKIALGRMAYAQEQANVISFLLSSESSYQWCGNSCRWRVLGH